MYERQEESKLQKAILKTGLLKFLINTLIVLNKAMGGEKMHDDRDKAHRKDWELYL